MKTKTILASLVLAVSVAAVALTAWVNRPTDSFFEANLEALMDTELPPAIISCNSGICGRCFEEISAWPFYKCNWTGRQDDYCDCNKI